MDKIIFLDVDGVLNTEGLFRAAMRTGRWTNCTYEEMRCDQLEPHLLENLVALVEQTGATIIVSSTWREFDTTRNILFNTLTALDLQVRDYTPYRHYHFRLKWDCPWEQLNRACEIYESLQVYKPDRYVILDDNNIFEPVVDSKIEKQLEPYFLQLDPETGLTTTTVEQAVKILNDF